MSDIQKIIGSLDGDELCRYCKYNDECEGDIRGGPDGPIYPPCADGLNDDEFDLETYLVDMEENNE